MRRYRAEPAPMVSAAIALWAMLLTFGLGFVAGAAWTDAQASRALAIANASADETDRAHALLEQCLGELEAR